MNPVSGGSFRRRPRLHPGARRARETESDSGDSGQEFYARRTSSAYLICKGRVPVTGKAAKTRNGDSEKLWPPSQQRQAGRPHGVVSFGTAPALLRWVGRRGTPPGGTQRVRSRWPAERTAHNGRLDTALDEAAAKGWSVVDVKRGRKIVRSRSHRERRVCPARFTGTSSACVCLIEEPATEGRGNGWSRCGTAHCPGSLA
jgi:hypothetical protein